MDRPERHLYVDTSYERRGLGKDGIDLTEDKELLALDNALMDAGLIIKV